VAIRTRKWATIGVMVELLFSVMLAVLVYYLQDLLSVEGIGAQLVILLLFIGLLITMSTYILKNHITFENSIQSEEHKKYLEIVRLWAELQNLEDEELREMAAKHVYDTTKKLRRLNEGRWIVERSHEIDTAIMRFLKDTQETIKATHIGVSKWGEKANEVIFKENVKAVDRNVRITRVFILTNEDCDNPVARRVIENHKRAGINVLCVKSSELQSDLVKDFIVFDGKKLLTEDLPVGVDHYTNAEVNVNPKIVRDWEEKFDFIANQAVDPAPFFERL
jgi:hypothetical protein